MTKAQRAALRAAIGNGTPADSLAIDSRDSHAKVLDAFEEIKVAIQAVRRGPSEAAWRQFIRAAYRAGAHAQVCLRAARADQARVEVIVEKLSGKGTV